MFCKFCNTEKDISRFSRKGKVHSTKCKDCHNTYIKDIWYKKNSKKQIESSRKWKHKNPERVLSTVYKIDINEIKSLKKEDHCPICNKKTKLVFDHCHISLKARGYICTNCNTLIGRLGDTKEKIIEKFNKIINYLS